MFFENVPEAPKDAIFGLKGAFKADPRNHKVDLCVGIFKTADLKAPVMEAAQKAAVSVLSEENVGSYLPFDGDPDFVECTASLILGDQFCQSNKERIYGAQTLGGTGGLYVLGCFLQKFVAKTIYIPSPSWANHKPVFEHAHLKVEEYPYYCSEKRGLDFRKLFDHLSKIPDKSVVLLHASCHNPTGSDPTIGEWKELSSLFRKKRFLPFFDLAYQGFGDGLDEDVASIRIFSEEHDEVLVVSTFSKNFSLYRQRIGSLFLLSDNKKNRDLSGGQIKRIIRTSYSNPPVHGALIVKEVLSNGNLRSLWEKELQSMRERLVAMRNLLVDHLTSKDSPVNYSFLREHKGMFSFCSLNKMQVQNLIEKHAIYMPGNGRLNVAGLNNENVGQIAQAILDVS